MELANFPLFETTRWIYSKKERCPGVTKRLGKKGGPTSGGGEERAIPRFRKAGVVLKGGPLFFLCGRIKKRPFLAQI